MTGHHPEVRHAPVGGRVVASPDGARLHVTEVGPADAPVVLLLHGVGSSSRFLREAFEVPLLAAGWRLAAADLRGHGRSTPVRTPDRHAFDHHVADVAALTAAVGAVVVGGVSLGAHAAVGAAAAGVPCRAVLACLPAWTGRAAPGEGPHAAVALEGARSGVDAMVARFRADSTMVPWLRDVLVRDWPRHDPASLSAALQALDGAQAPTPAELRDLDVPLALVGWPDDPGHPLAVVRDWASLVTRSHVVETSLSALAPDRTALGHAAVRALSALGVAPR